MEWIEPYIVYEIRGTKVFDVSSFDIEEMASKTDMSKYELSLYLCKNNYGTSVQHGMYKDENVMEILWKNHDTISELSEKTGYASSTISKYLDKYGIRQKQSRNTEKAKDVDERLSEVYGFVPRQYFGKDVVYVIRGVEASGKDCYYVGETTRLRGRLDDHAREPPERFAEIKSIHSVEQAENRHDRERERFLETAIENNTTNVYGGK